MTHGSRESSVSDLYINALLHYHGIRPVRRELTSGERVVFWYAEQDETRIQDLAAQHADGKLAVGLRDYLWSVEAVKKMVGETKGGSRR